MRISVLVEIYSLDPNPAQIPLTHIHPFQNKMPHVRSLLQTLDSTTETLNRSALDLDQTDRRQLLQACDRLQRSLESPADTTARLVFSVCRWRGGCGQDSNRTPARSLIFLLIFLEF